MTVWKRQCVFLGRKRRCCARGSDNVRSEKSRSSSRSVAWLACFLQDLFKYSSSSHKQPSLSFLSGRRGPSRFIFCLARKLSEPMLAPATLYHPSSTTKSVSPWPYHLFSVTTSRRASSSSLCYSVEGGIAAVVRGLCPRFTPSSRTWG